MITRREAVTQAEHCFEYHVAIAAAVTGVMAIFDRKAFPWVASSLGAGLALHAVCLYAVPSTRESLIKTTASLMEDRRRALSKNSDQSTSPRMASSAAS